ncbi:hypothetical protein V497_03180 [Pseudogymnoascus sp. VKM F-4516 (FW-969)]|nr:hypothetical protein V497_03180 [Pseudogymnoascus sp. VKM F-4516 (FW-969)]
MYCGPPPYSTTPLLRLRLQSITTTRSSTLSVALSPSYKSTYNSFECANKLIILPTSSCLCYMGDLTAAISTASS